MLRIFLGWLSRLFWRILWNWVVFWSILNFAHRILSIWGFYHYLYFQKNKMCHKKSFALLLCELNKNKKIVQNFPRTLDWILHGIHAYQGSGDIKLAVEWNGGLLLNQRNNNKNRLFFSFHKRILFFIQHFHKSIAYYNFKHVCLVLLTSCGIKTSRIK